MQTSDGWTPQGVLERVMAIAPGFLPPTRSGQVFTWDPV